MFNGSYSHKDEKQNILSFHDIYFYVVPNSRCSASFFVSYSCLVLVSGGYGIYRDVFYISLSHWDTKGENGNNAQIW